MDEILKKAKIMLECGELRIVFDEFDYNFEGATIENNNQNVIVINSKLSYEKQQKKLLHEIKHLDHIKTNVSTEKCEKEAIEYSDNVKILSYL